jgi:hypothetical protein
MLMSDQKPGGDAWWRSHPWYGGHLFAANRENFPHEEIMEYLGKWVAWYPDGSGIFDSDPDPIALHERIVATGDEPAMYPVEHISDEPCI